MYELTYPDGATSTTDDVRQVCAALSAGAVVVAGQAKRRAAADADAFMRDHVVFVSVTA